jgi:3-deoxy-7-phosphoheptulonate synthase
VLDLNVVEPVRRATPLPIIADPSHAAGRWEPIESLSRAALAAGVHGLLVEVVLSEEMRATLHCDAEQGIPPEILRRVTGAAASMGPATVD